MLISLGETKIIWRMFMMIFLNLVGIIFNCS